MSTAERVREAARNDTNTDRLVELASDRSPRVRATVVDNPAAPLSVVVQLLQDSHREVRSALAVRAVQHPALLELILREGSVQLRALLTEEAIRSAPAGDDPVDEISRASPQQTAGVHVLLQPHTGRYSRSRPVLPFDAQRRLADDEAWQVRAGLASTTHHPSLLARLAADENWRVRVQCLNNDLLTAEQIARLLHDPRRDVRAWVAGTASLTEEQMDDVAEHDRSTDVLDMLIHRADVPTRILQRITTHPDPQLAAAARFIRDGQS